MRWVTAGTSWVVTRGAFAQKPNVDPAGVHAVDPPPAVDRDGSTRRKRLVATGRSLGACCRRHCDEECAARTPPERLALERARESARARPSDRAPDSARTKPPARRNWVSREARTQLARPSSETTRPRFGYLQMWVLLHREGWQLKARAPALPVARPLGAPPSRAPGKVRSPTAPKTRWLVATALSAAFAGRPIGRRVWS